MGKLDRQRKRWGDQMLKLTKFSTILGAALCAALILPVTAQAQSVRTIRNDGGGVVNEYIIRANLAVLQGERLRIDGWCASACTAYLGNPNTCVTPSAQFGFHGPSGGTPAENQRAAQTLARHLPAVLHDWYLTKAAPLQGNDHIAISGKELVRIGAAHWC